MKVLKVKYNYIVYLWFFLWSFNLFGYGTRYVFFGGFLLIIFFLFHGIKKPDKNVIALSIIILLFGITYSATINYFDTYSFFRGYREFLLPVILYWVGYIHIYNQETLAEAETVTTNSFIVLSISFTLYGLVNLYFHLKKYHQVLLIDRKIYDIWLDDLIAATAQGSKFTLIVSFLIILLLCFREFKLITKIILITSIILAFTASIIMANRSIFIVSLISFIVTSIFYIYYNKKSIKKITLFIASLVTLISLIIVLFLNNMFNMKNFYENSAFKRRMEIAGDDWLSENSRLRAWQLMVENLYYAPFGGSKIDIGLTYAHNLWLDIAYKAGIIPLFFIIILTLVTLKYIINISSSDDFSQLTKLLIISISSSLFLSLFIEPVLEGHYALFMVFILLIGMMQGLQSYSKNLY